MPTKTITIRLPGGLAHELDRKAWEFKFESFAQFVSYILTDMTLRTLTGKNKRHYYIRGCQFPVGCRVSLGVYNSIRYIASRYDDTPSAWCGAALYVWLQELVKYSAKRDKESPFAWHDLYGQELLQNKPAMLQEIDRLYTRLKQ